MRNCTVPVAPLEFSEASGKQSAGQLIGIEFRLKELPSIQRKLIFETTQSTSKTIQEVMNTRMTDTLRYTILYPTNTYVNQAAKYEKEKGG